MINLENLDNSKPYQRFFELYKAALDTKQHSIEAIAISSYDQEKDLVDSRFVNLKFIKNNEWTFFSNYESPKAFAFKTHEQISILIYWNKINVQIRMRANIWQSDDAFSNLHFLTRDNKKNAIAISSMQSKPVESYKEVKANFLETLNHGNLQKRPNYWGGFSFKPYYFEFWEGHSSRLNKREVYEKNNNDWHCSILQP
tara:strand:+ start:1426 stop:2022 length:597 start_codon:yes stop_codon:yes gene_type:complete